MEPLAHGGVSQRGRGLGGELVALSGQHCQRGAAEAGVILKEKEGQLAEFFGRAFWGAVRRRDTLPFGQVQNERARLKVGGRKRNEVSWKKKGLTHPSLGHGQPKVIAERGFV